jgi:hypothetical protein
MTISLPGLGLAAAGLASRRADASDHRQLSDGPRFGGILSFVEPVLATGSSPITDPYALLLG